MQLNREAAWKEFEALMPEGSEFDSGFEQDWVERVLEEAEEQLKKGARADTVARGALWVATVHEFVAMAIRMNVVADEHAILIVRQAFEDAHFHLNDGKTVDQVAYDNHVVANSFLAAFSELTKEGDTNGEVAAA
jgi:hypothetical protein